MKRNHTIEVFRFVCTVYVVICHFYSAFGWVFKRPGNGWYAVEFFFVLSGCLLMHSCARYDGDTSTPPWQQSWTILKGRYLRLLPTWFTACSASYVLNILNGKYPLQELHKSVARNFPLFLMFVEGNAYADHGVAFGWYVITMLLAFALLLPLITANRKRFAYCFAPLIAFSSTAYLWHTYGTIMVLQQAWIGFSYASLIRAVGEICVGCIAYEIAATLRSRYANRVNPRGRLLVTAGGLLLLMTPLYWMTFRLPKENQIPGLFLLGAGMALQFSDLGYFDRLFRGRFWGWLGQFSFSLYLAQGLPRLVLSSRFGTMPDKTFFFLYMAAVFLSGLAVHFTSLLLVKICRAVRAWFLQAFFPPNAA